MPFFLCNFSKKETDTNFLQLMSVFMYHHSSVDDVSSIFLTYLSLFFLSDKGVIDFAKIIIVDAL